MAIRNFSQSLEAVAEIAVENRKRITKESNQRRTEVVDIYGQPYVGQGDGSNAVEFSLSVSPDKIYMERFQFKIELSDFEAGIKSIGETRLEISGAPESGCPFPVNSILTLYDNTDPNNLWEGTEWERFGNGRTLVGVDESQTEFNAPGKTGGAKTHTLTTAQMPSHTHAPSVSGDSFLTSNGNISVNQTKRKRPASDSDGFCIVYAGSTSSSIQESATTKATGSGQAHNNMQPYITVYLWRRKS